MSPVAYRRTDDPGFTRVGTPARTTDERYLLEVTTGPDLVTVVHCSDRGRQWGTAHAQRLLARGGLVAGTYDEHPRFAVRGIIEGFYGRPWTQEQRLDMVRFLGSHRMNTFVYSPKDDPFCRFRWRDPYPPDALARLAEVVEVAAECSVDVSYGLSPGLSMRYSDPSDVEALLAKYGQVVDLGVRHLQLLLDDIPASLQHAEDQAAHRDLVSAHVDLVARVRRGLDAIDPRLQLAVCPTDYHGRGDEAYITALGAGTDPRIDLLWTGRAICSPELDLVDAATFVRTTSRPVLYWDNYPVNDVAMTAELHLGAYRGRDPHLYRFSRGVIANPMERPESSKIALATIADYLWDPEGYDPERSWASAIAEVAGARDAEALGLFADNVRSSCLEEADALLLTAALERLEFEEAHGDPAAGRAALAGLAARFAAAADQLLGPDVENPVLAQEIRPWVEVFGAGARQLLDLLDGSSDLTSDYGPPRAPQVFGDVLDMYVRAAEGRIDTPDGGALT